MNKFSTDMFEENGAKFVEEMNSGKNRLMQGFKNSLFFVVGLAIIMAMIATSFGSIEIKSAIQVVSFTLTLVIYWFCIYSMFIVYFSYGENAGRKVSDFVKCTERYGKAKNHLQESDSMGRLSEFCVWYSSEALKADRQTILGGVSVSYQKYVEEYTNHTKAELEQMKLAKCVVKAVLAADKLKPIKLTPNMITTMGDKPTRRHPLGVAPNVKKRLTFGSKVMVTTLTSLVTAVIGIQLIVSVTWETIILCLIKLVAVIMQAYNGFIGGYNLITVDTVNYANKQIDLMEEFYRYCIDHPPQKALPNLAIEQTQKDVKQFN